MIKNGQGPVHQPGVFNIEVFDGHHWRGGMNRCTRDAAIATAKQWSAEHSARHRVFSPEGELVFDSEMQKADLLATFEALASGIPDVDVADYRKACATLSELICAARRARNLLALHNERCPLLDAALAHVGGAA